jgi:type II secretory pathway component PulK
MTFFPANRLPITARRSRERGSVLIIVMWVAFGLVSIALYFAHSMTFELRASENRVASLEAEQAIAGAARYVNYLLTNLATNGAVPDPAAYQREAALVGEARFWLIGRGDHQGTPAEPFFNLVDEPSKLNLNTASLDMLTALPRMTPELAAAIIDWRDADSTVSPGGAETDTYMRLQPPYNCKNAPFETLDELRLVYGADLDILYGEDVNLNGVLDPNENDGPLSPPNDNRDGRLDPGIFEYLTVYSRQPNTRTNINTTRELTALLQQKLGTARANQILRRPGVAAGNRSVLEFYLKSQMTADEFAQIASAITFTNSAYIEGLINVNTASAEVLACVPGIGTDKAQSLVAYRQSNPDKLTSVAWVAQALDRSSAIQAGPYLTVESYQFTADIAAVGHHGRGYNRARFIFDVSEGAPKIRYRQDLTRLGWALGQTTRQRLLLANELR